MATLCSPLIRESDLAVYDSSMENVFGISGGIKGSVNFFLAGICVLSKLLTMFPFPCLFFDSKRFIPMQSGVSTARIPDSDRSKWQTSCPVKVGKDPGPVPGNVIRNSHNVL